MTRVTPIQAETLAAKMEKLVNFELPEVLYDEFANEPRLTRALWYLQFVSWPQNYPGGLTKFATDFIEASGDRVGTAGMAKRPKGLFYSLEQAIELLAELPYHDRDELLGQNSWLLMTAFGKDRHQTEFWSDDRDLELEEKVRKARSREGRNELKEEFLQHLSPQRVHRYCLEAARQGLAEYLKNVCEYPDVSWRRQKEDGLDGAPWYFADVANALLDYIDVRSETLRARLAETEVTKAVFEWMTFSLEEQKSVMISGNSRFGKTEAFKLKIEMHPGVRRLVHTPGSGTLGDLIRKIAESLGMEVGSGRTSRELRERVEYVLKFSRLQLCFDEAQFAIIPTSFTRNTPPARLNWIRRAVMDQGVPVVFACTPQSYHTAKTRFLKATGFAMEQFDERIYTHDLPTELPEADLLAVARVHFSDLSDDHLQFVVQTALATERNYVSDIEKIATRAKYNARKNGRRIPTLIDIKAAIGEVLPQIGVTTLPLIEKRKLRTAAASRKKPCRTSAAALQPPRRGLETLDHSRMERSLEVLA